jgi:hypothetical protein
MTFAAMLFAATSAMAQVGQLYDVEGAKLGRKIGRQVVNSNFDRTVTTNKVETWHGMSPGDNRGNHRLTSFAGAVDGAVMGSVAHSYKYQRVYHGEHDFMYRKKVENSADISKLEISDIIYADDDNDGALGKDETAQIHFDLINTGDEPLYGVMPVLMANKTKHVLIAPPAPIDTLQAQHAIRYVIELSGDGKSNPGKVSMVLRIKYGQGQYVDVQEICLAAKRRKN